MHLDSRNRLIGGLLRIPIAMHCEVVNKGHKFPDETYRIQDAGLTWYVAKCKLCETVIYVPENRERDELVQLAS